MRRYRLGVPEMAEVESAVTQGRALTDERLRAAAAEWARTNLDLLEAHRRRHPLAHRLALWSPPLTLAFLGAAAVLPLVAGEDIGWPLLLVLLNSVVQVWLLIAVRVRQPRVLRRAVEVNTGPVPAEPTHRSS